MRKQAAITLRCMQALVRVQARVRARRVRIALESQTVQQRLQQQLANEAHVREIEASISTIVCFNYIHNIPCSDDIFTYMLSLNF